MECFTLKVIGFSKVFYEGEASQVQLPIQDGSMGILAHHEAAVIGIVPGTLRLQKPDGEWETAVVDAGFARVGENTVSVMVEDVLRPDEIDEERERRALAEAQEKGYAEADPSADVDGLDAAAKIAIFQCAGSIILLAHQTRVDELRGLGRRMPVTFICFALVSLSMVGIPPFGGFHSKWYLATAALEGLPGALGYLVPVTLILSALFTAGYLFPPVISAFFPGHDTTGLDLSPIREPLGITVPLVVGYLAQGYGFAPALVYISAVALIGALSYILLVGDVKRVG